MRVSLSEFWAKRGVVNLCTKLACRVEDVYDASTDFGLRQNQDIRVFSFHIRFETLNERVRNEKCDKNAQRRSADLLRAGTKSAYVP